MEFQVKGNNAKVLQNTDKVSIHQGTPLCVTGGKSVRNSLLCSSCMFLDKNKQLHGVLKHRKSLVRVSN